MRTELKLKVFKEFFFKDSTETSFNFICVTFLCIIYTVDSDLIFYTN